MKIRNFLREDGWGTRCSHPHKRYELAIRIPSKG